MFLTRFVGRAGRGLGRVQPSSVQQQGLDIAKNMLKNRARMYIGGVAVAGVGVYYGFVHESEEGVTSAMVTLFEEGTIRSWCTEEDGIASVARVQLHEELNLLLHPQTSDSYCVVHGENGTGKSTAVRQTIASLEDPKGVIYMMTPPCGASQFVPHIARAVGYREAIDIPAYLRRRLQGVTKEEGGPRQPDVAWRLLISKIMEVAAAYKLKHGRPAVLVIDDADIIAKENPAFLTLLQTAAKNGADTGTLRIVFVSSEGHALPLLQAHSHWSRGRVHEVGDIEDEEAVKYLVDVKEVDETRASEAVEKITGGRFALLNEFARDSQKKTNEAILEELHDTTKERLLLLGVKADHELFQMILHPEPLRSADAARLVGIKNLDALAKGNIITIHNNGIVTFNSRHVESFFASGGMSTHYISCYVDRYVFFMGELVLFAGGWHVLLG